ncbi:hypothetical protein BGZ70_009640 [Mortierella alpina]|uniref:Cytochrome b5 heme-binding domain-containing protein n=1 Tax=Mortierella alpina TaxID=64518 RepID=A0A9P6JHD0_MORAP|nr:hypothetical protein BGZ70_009640 [Mortierella alpina]
MNYLNFITDYLENQFHGKPTYEYLKGLFKESYTIPIIIATLTIAVISAYMEEQKIQKREKALLEEQKEHHTEDSGSDSEHSSQATKEAASADTKPKAFALPSTPLPPPNWSRIFTSEELKEHDGTEENSTIYVAIKGTVFDVTAKKAMYGPGGGYHCFAGRDASKALGMSSLKVEDCVADYSGLTEKELKTMEDWYTFFEKRYPIVGKTQAQLITMAGSSRASSSKSTAGASGRVQKKAPSKASSKASSAGSAAVYTGTAKGVTQLPVARIKRIIKEDKDVQMVSNDAVFIISLATEMFLESFTSKAFNLAKLEKRKTVSYKDLATAVSQHDSLEFLQDVVPKTMPLSAALEKQRVATEQVELGDMEEEGEDEQEVNGNGVQEESGDEAASEGRNSSRPMSDEDNLSGAEDMDED